MRMQTQVITVLASTSLGLASLYEQSADRDDLNAFQKEWEAYVLKLRFRG